MSIELKPCPFCGGEAVLQAIDFEPDYDDLPIWWVRCSSCLAETAEFTGATEAEAIAAWNTRKEPITIMSPITTVSAGEPQTYVPLRTCENESEWNEVDGFVCSVCGIRLEGWSKIVEDEEQEFYYEYAFKYCPNCGAKVVEE